MAGPFKLLSYNCRGLNNPVKIRWVSNELTKVRPSVIFLQETHQKKALPRLIKSNWFPHEYQAPGSSKARGVAILFSKTLPIRDPVCQKDPTGCYIFVKMVMDDIPYTFASIYSPNTNQLTFLKDTLVALEAFKAGEVLIGGDLNTVIDPRLDRCSKTKKKPRTKTHANALSPLLTATGVSTG